jgi:hypothetical protein
MSNKVFPVLVALLPFAVFGYGYPASLGTGTGLAGYDAVTASTGGVSSIDVGGSSLMLNPSGLGLLRSSRVQFGVGPVLSKESVETPFGIFNISSIALGSTGLTAAFPLSEGLGAGIGIVRRSDFSYTGEYYDTIIEGVDTVIVFEQQNNSGSVWDASAGVGTRLMNGLYAGAAVGYLFGSGTQDYFFANSIDTAYSVVETWDESAVVYRAGLTAVIKRVRAGATYSSGMDRHPARASFGAAIGDMSAWEPSIGVDTEILFPGDSTSFAARIFGGTLLSGNEFYGRASVFLFTSQGSDAREGTGLSIGASLKVAARLDLDAAFSWTSEKRTGDTFGGYSDQATVTDTNTGITFGLTWKP